MTSTEDRIKEIEEELRRTPHNKATEKHIARLKARLAKLREISRKPKKARTTKALRKSGDATVALVGLPSVGKSTLLNRITEAKSRVGDYDFTTLAAVPGLLNHRGARIQVLDLPGLTRGASAGRGRGREVLSQVRIADLLLMMIDVTNPDLATLVSELHASGIRVNQEPPRISLHRKERGGIDVNSTVQQAELEAETMREVLREWGIVNADLVVQENLTLTRLVDFLAGNRAYVPGMVVLNKVDLLTAHEVEAMVRDLGSWGVAPISAKTGQGLEELLQEVYLRLSLVRVYLRPPGGDVNRQRPLVLKKGASVSEVCRLVHRDLLRNFRHAEVWGKSAKFPGQRVGLNHTLEDGDTVSIMARAT